MFIPMTFQAVLYPRVIHGTDDYEVTIRSLRWGFYSWGGIVLLMILLAKPILFIYGGRNYLPAVTTFRIFMIAAWFLPLSSLVAPYCVKIGAFYAMVITAVILGLIGVVLNLYLIPNFSGTGAALATASTCMIGFLISLFLLGYLSKRNPLEFIKLKISLYGNI
jgi:PST family polysaccharide transporter